MHPANAAAMAASAILATGVDVPRFGDSKAAALQSALIRLGADIGSIDGQIGPRSLAALAALGVTGGSTAALLSAVEEQLRAAFPGEHDASALSFGVRDSDDERLFWEAIAAGGAPELSLRWLRDEAWRHLKQSGRGGLTGEALVDLAQSVSRGERTRAQARAALQALITGETPTPHEPEAIDLSTLVQTVFNEAPELHARLNAGETRLEAHFIGQVMRRGQGAWSPAEVLNTIRATAKRS